MDAFQKEMATWKEQWRLRMEAAHKQTRPWQWEGNWGDKFDGEYSGQWEGDKPHGVGVGRWKDRYETVEGEWRDGRLHGHAVQNHSDGDRAEYEVKDGKIHGKYIGYYNDGRRV